MPVIWKTRILIVHTYIYGSTFLQSDYDNELSLRERCQKKQDRINNEVRTVNIDRLIDGIYNLFQFPENMVNSLANGVSKDEFINDPQKTRILTKKYRQYMCCLS